MADITRNANRIALVFPNDAERYDYEMGTVIPERGQTVYFDANGRVDLADANVAGRQQTRGICLETLGRGCSVLKRGHVFGYNVDALAYDAPVYQSDTAGEISDTPGTLNRVLGRVVPLSDAGVRTKVVYFDIPWRETST